MNDTNWFHDLTTDEARQERATLAQRIIAVLGVLCLIVLVGVATNAYAADVFRAPGPDGKDAMVLRLHDTNCIDKDVLEYLHENILDDRRFKKADLEWEGQPFGACWIELNGRVHPIASDKKPIQPPIPVQLFKPEGV